MNKSIKRELVSITVKRMYTLNYSDGFKQCIYPDDVTQMCSENVNCNVDNEEKEEK